MAVVLAPAPSTQWFPCPHCGSPVPVVVPRDPPPLYSWEVLPELYPPLPPPRRSRWQGQRVVAFVLVAVAVVAIALLGALAGYGVEANSPAHYPVNGVVVGPTGNAAVGAKVVLSEEGGVVQTQTIGPNGSFYFFDVPSGGISLNITLDHYAPVTVDTFATPVYDTGTTGLEIQLAVGNASNGTTYLLSPFPDLDTLLASIGAGASLLGLIAAVAVSAAILTYRRDRIPLGVVGGSAGVCAPVSLYFLSLTVVFPTLALIAGIAGALGAFALGWYALELARRGAPVRSA